MNKIQSSKNAEFEKITGEIIACAMESILKWYVYRIEQFEHLKATIRTGTLVGRGDIEEQKRHLRASFLNLSMCVGMYDAASDCPTQDDLYDAYQAALSEICEPIVDDVPEPTE